MNDRVEKRVDRRLALQLGAGSAVVAALGYYAFFPGEEDNSVRRARSERHQDGRSRVPPGQRVIRTLRPMGGQQGDPDPSNWKLRLHGEVRRPISLNFRDLLARPQVEQVCDVHCVTAWTCLDTLWTGVRLADLADAAGLLSTARYVVFEAAGGYTANVPLQEALKPNVLIAHKLFGDPLAIANGAPVRSLVPDLYFWKSSKWLTGIGFAAEDQPGYWEVRGYHNHGDPWREERYS